MLLLIFCGAIFNGCAPKVEYVYVKCEIDIPKRLYQNNKCGELKELEEFVYCVIEKDRQKETDIENLETALKSCK
jgi:hypothetical protein